MVSQAWKLRWGRVAFGLALVPALAVVNVAPAQTGTPSSSFAAVRDADPAAGKPASAESEEAVRSLVKQGRDALKGGEPVPLITPAIGASSASQLLDYRGTLNDHFAPGMRQYSDHGRADRATLRHRSA